MELSDVMAGGGGRRAGFGSLRIAVLYEVMDGNLLVMLMFLGQNDRMSLFNKGFRSKASSAASPSQGRPVTRRDFDFSASFLLRHSL